MVKTQVVVVGAGIVGSFVFNTLVLAGIDTVLIDKQEDVSESHDLPTSILGDISYASFGIVFQLRKRCKTV